MGGRTMVMVAVLLCAAVLVAGCASPRPPAEVSARDIVGLWSNPELKGQPASLSEIGFQADGTFRHSGSNALGLPVNFGGRYQVSTSPEGQLIQLIYDDFPDRPENWFFQLDGDTLTIAPVAAGLNSPAATVLKRAQQQ